MVRKSGVLSAVIWLVIVTISFRSSVEANRVVCSFSSTAAKRTGEYAFRVEDIPVSLCTHVIYDRMEIDVMTNELIASNPSYDVLEDGWEKFGELKTANPDLKLILSIRSPFLLQVTSVPEQRQALVESVKMYMEWMKADGVELFWTEAFGKSDEMYPLIEALKKYFLQSGHPDWEVIVMDTINHSEVDYARLCQTADFVHVFPENRRAPHISESGPRLLSDGLINMGDKKNLTTEEAVQYWIDNGCPASRIVLGVVFAGQKYTITKEGTVEPGSECPHTDRPTFCGYFELCEMFNQSEWKQSLGGEHGTVPVAELGDQWVTYDNEATIARKGMLARTKQLAGVCGYALDLDDYRGKCGTAFPLMRALRESYTG